MKRNYKKPLVNIVGLQTTTLLAISQQISNNKEEDDIVAGMPERDTEDFFTHFWESPFDL